jgi:IclR family transcriptional regulator, acetate operon repressor
MRPVQIALQILDALGGMQPAGVTELARALNLPKSTTQRALSSLHEVGWIELRDPTHSRWSLSLKALLVFGRAAQTEHRLRSAALPLMETIRRETGESVFLAIRHANSVVLVERLDGLKPLYHFWPIGSAAPLHSLSLGKAILAFLSPSEIDEYLSAPLQKRTPHTVTDPAAIKDELALIRSRGFTVALMSNWATENAVGAPIVNPDGTAHAAISISAPADRFTEAQCLTTGPLLADAARRISFSLNSFSTAASM